MKESRDARRAHLVMKIRAPRTTGRYFQQLRLPLMIIGSTQHDGPRRQEMGARDIFQEANTL